MKNIIEDLRTYINRKHHKFNSDDMLIKIAEKIPCGEEKFVSVSHHGKWNGAYNYKVSKNFISYEGHSWMTSGNVRLIYKEIVLK